MHESQNWTQAWAVTRKSFEVVVVVVVGWIHVDQWTLLWSGEVIIISHPKVKLEGLKSW